MHTLSDQLHATNMVSFVCVCVWRVCGVCSLSLLRGAAGALLQLCYG